MTIRLIDIVLVGSDDYVHTLIYDRNNTILDNWEDWLYEILRSVRKPYLLASYQVSIITQGRTWPVACL